MTDTYNAAIELARRGLSVFPVDDPTRARCLGMRTEEHDPPSCTERGKHPVVAPTKRSTRDKDEIRKLFFGLPRNVGVFCGPGLLVIDEDVADAFTNYASSVGAEVPLTYTVRTGKGRHYYFAVPSGLLFSNHEGALHGRGINVRSGNAYVVAAGSVHASGRHYEVETDAPLAPMPGWLVEAIRGTSTVADEGPENPEAAGWWRRGPIGENDRHRSISSAAGHCRQLGLPIEDAITIAREVATRHQPHKYSDAQIVGKVRDHYARYTDGAKVRDWLQSLDEPEQADAEVSALHREVARLRLQRDARRLVEADDRAGVHKPEVLTLRQRLARPIPDTTYRIAGWQPVGSRVVLAAQFKAGKTTATGNLARSLVDGDAWLDKFDVTPIGGTLAILDFEMSARQMDQWLGDQGVRNDDRVIPIPMRGNALAFDILDPARRTEWARELRRLECQYLMLDCLRPVLDALGLDEHHDAGRFLVAFDALLDEAAVAEAVVVHHMGHTGERSRGDSRIRDWPDVEWRLVRESDDPASPRYISAFGRDVEQGEGQLIWDETNRHLSLGGGNRKETAARLALNAVLAFVDEQPGLSGRGIEAGLRESSHGQKAIREAVHIGFREGFLDRKPGSTNGYRYFSAAVRQTASAVRQRGGDECVSASIDDALAHAQWTQPSASAAEADEDDRKERYR